MSNKTAQEQNQATASTVKNLVANIDLSLKEGQRILSQALQHITKLATNTDYAVGTTKQTLTLFTQRLRSFQSVIENPETARSQRLPPLTDLPTPSEDNEIASTLYRDGMAQLDIFHRMMTQLLPQLRQAITLLKNPLDREEDWAAEYKPAYEKFQNLITAILSLGFEKAPTASSNRFTVRAYPLSFQWQSHTPPADVKKWKTTATQLAAFKRAYPEYTFPQVLYHFTSEWDMFERHKFKNWYKWTQKKAETQKTMEKKAFQDYIVQDQAQKFQKKKKLLMSRIDLVRKALRDLINNSLIDTPTSNKIYKILAMLEYEALGIAAPKLASARLRRAGKQLHKLGFTEGSSVLFSTARELVSTPSLVKTAQEKELTDKTRVEQTTQILRRIKTQMDKLSYTKHLDELFYIKKELEKMGRDGDAESILKIIKDDLDSLDKLNKKLTDVYTNLSRLPVELSMKEDEEITSEIPYEKVQEMPLEVTEEETGKSPLAAKPAPIMPTAPAKLAPTSEPTKTPPPKIETRTPNV
jgi:hypothetical protein